MFYPILLFSLQKRLYRECSFNFSSHVYNIINICISSHFPLSGLREGDATVWHFKCCYYLVRCSCAPSGAVLCHWACILIILPVPPFSGCWTTLGKVLFFSWAHLALKPDCWYIPSWQEFCRKCKASASLTQQPAPPEAPRGGLLLSAFLAWRSEKITLNLAPLLALDSRRLT